MVISLLSLTHIILAILLIIVVLLQRSESSMGALGGSNAVFTGKSVSSILTKATTIIAILFVIVSLMIVRQNYQTKTQESVVETIQVEDTTDIEETKVLETQEPSIPAVK